jgi:hypothetical protein
VPISSFFGGLQRFAGQKLGEAQRAYQQADKSLGGWLPGGGTASPLTRSKQEGERRLLERYNRAIDSQSAAVDYVGKPGRFAGEGRVLNAIRAVTTAGANPIGVATGNPEEIKKVANYYGSFPDVTNQYDLSTNMFLRYLSGTGAEGLKVSPELGKQLYSDIRQQETKFINPETQNSIFLGGKAPDYVKTKVATGATPVYYGGLSDAVAPNRAVLPTDVGQRWQLATSLGSFWTRAKDPSNAYTIENEKYDFVYAPRKKGGTTAGENVTFLPTNPVDIGRRIVQQGYGKPFSYSADVSPTGNVEFNPR